MKQVKLSLKRDTLRILTAELKNVHAAVGGTTETVNTNWDTCNRGCGEPSNGDVMHCPPDPVFTADTVCICGGSAP